MRRAQTLGQGITNQTQLDAMGIGRRAMLGQTNWPSPADLAAGRLAPLNLYDSGTSPTSPSTSTASPTPPAAATGSAASTGNNTTVDPLDDFGDKAIAAESGGDTGAKNPRSSATGPGQFIDSTWLDLARRNYPEAATMGDKALLALRSDPDVSRDMVKAYARDNAGALSDAGLPVNNTSLYLGHLLGPQGATKLLTADPNIPLNKLFSPNVISGNNWGELYAGDLVGIAQKKMGDAAPTQVADASGGTASTDAGPPAPAAAPNSGAGSPQPAGYFGALLSGRPPQPVTVPGQQPVPAPMPPRQAAATTVAPSGGGWSGRVARSIPCWRSRWGYDIWDCNLPRQ